MRRVLFFFLTLAASLTFFNMTDCGSSESGYISYVSLESSGKDLKVILRQVSLSPVDYCSYDSDGRPDTTTFSCVKVDGNVYDTTVIFTDSTVVTIDGHRALCQHFESRYMELRQTIVKVESLNIDPTTSETLNVSGVFSYPSDSASDMHCNDTDFENYEFSLSLHLRPDSPYVWIRPVGYDSVFVSPETTAYLIEEPFPFTATDSFRLAHRRVIKLHRGKFYHYGSVELVSDSEGWATLRVSFSVVPKLGWTLPPVDTTI